MQGDEKNSQMQFAQIKKIKPATPKEYIDLSDTLFEITGLESSIKTVDNAIKKFPNSYELYSQKMKLYFMADEPEKLKNTLEQTQKLFN